MINLIYLQPLVWADIFRRVWTNNCDDAELKRLHMEAWNRAVLKVAEERARQMIDEKKPG